MIDGSGANLETTRWAGMFDLSLAGAGDRYTGATDLVDVSRYGHFTDPELTWERVRFDDPGCHGVIREWGRNSAAKRRVK
jgi:hypothetical protein